MGSKGIGNVATLGLLGGATGKPFGKDQPRTAPLSPIVAQPHGPIEPIPPQPVWTPPPPRQPVGPADPFGLQAQQAPPFPFLPPSWAGWRR